LRGDLAISTKKNINSENMPGKVIMDGIELNDEYVNMYTASHTYDTKYRLAYVDYLILNNIFEKPFSALITGCGTCGYSKLLSNAYKITGVDLSKKMLEAAKKINSENGINLHLINEDIIKFPSVTTEKYDFIELSLLGSYIPFENDIVKSYFNLLNEDGIILIRIAVTSVSGFDGKYNSTLFGIRYSVSSRLRDIMHIMLGTRRRASITVAEINKKIKLFFRANCEAKLLCKYVFQISESPGTTLHLLIKKTGKKICNDS
jgi:SAM-dependent methyltransferase